MCGAGEAAWLGGSKLLSEGTADQQSWKKQNFQQEKATKENHLAKNTERTAKRIVVTLEDNHSRRHLKIIVVNRQMIKIASLCMKCAPSRLTAALHIVQSLLLQMITHP